MDDRQPTRPTVVSPTAADGTFARKQQSSIGRPSGRTSAERAAGWKHRPLSFPPRSPEGAGALNTDRWAALRRLHDSVARRLGERFAAELSCPLEVDLIDLQSTTIGSLLLSRPVPTCFAVLRAQPLHCRLLLEIRPAVLYPMLDCMLGGSTDAAHIAARPMTEIESLLAQRAIGWFIETYAEAWEHVLSLELAVERLEHNPRRIRNLPAADPLMQASWLVRMPGVRDQIELGVPLSAIRLMTEKLTGSAYTAALEPPQIEPAV